jgi:hypothetical protein
MSARSPLPCQREFNSMAVLTHQVAILWYRVARFEVGTFVPAPAYTQDLETIHWVFLWR